MLVLATFAALALVTAGTCAVLKGDTLLFAALLVALCLVVLVVAPQAPAVLHAVQQAMDAAGPLARS